MFSIENNLPFITGLYDIKADYCSLLNDGVNDLLYTGTNIYNSKILGSIVFEDDEEGYLRYMHTLIADETLVNFLNQKIDLRSIILSCNMVFIIDKDYNRKPLKTALIPISDLPVEFLPLENSFCPDFIKSNTLSYTFSLKGELADLHKAEPLSMSNTNRKIYSLLSNSISFLPDLNINAKIYSEVAVAGSFELNFEIELNVPPVNLFTRSTNDIKIFIFDFLKYLLETLPIEPVNALKEEEGATENLKHLFTGLTEIYDKRNVSFHEHGIEQKVIDSITYSVDSIKDLDYKGFNRIEVGNRLESGEKIPLALIKTDYYDSVADKIFKPDKEKELEIIEVDETPKDYKIQVYSLNKESGNGSAYYLKNDQVMGKISFHLKGKTDYHGTIYTKSLDGNASIQIKGIGKWVNNALKQITIDL